MKHFIDDPERVVRDAIDAEILLGEGTLARLDGYPDVKVVVRTDRDPSHVAVVSGGGSGHEPAHAGFVGDGMLTAAVCGEIFASPSVDAVLAAIVNVTGDAGCLLVVKNYTGDRLNFGLAAARARALGLKVEMVVVADDVAIEGAAQPRGLAGTLFVHKVAGHLARSGASLSAVKAAAERVARGAVTIGIALSTCTIPGRPTETRIGPDEVELGLGIHGEPGARVVALAAVTELVQQMVGPLERALDERDPSRTAPLALLVNELGGVPPIEAAVATRAVLAVVTSSGRNVSLVIGPGRMMTSLDMKGFSVSALPLDVEVERALLTQVGPRAWPVARRMTAPPAPLALAHRAGAANAAASAHPERRSAFERVCRALIAGRADLDALDAKVGDGDTGTTFATAASGLLAAADELPFADAPALFGAVGDRLASAMGGTSGVLSAILAAAIGASLRDGASAAHALFDGVERISAVGGAREGDRTMLDALGPAARALLEGGGVTAAARAAREGAEKTAHMGAARAGRASYVRADLLRGVSDPGAVAVSIIFEALAAR